MNKKIFASRYEVIYLLGKRPGYRTILCRDLRTEQLVVVKFIVWNEEFEWENLRLFEREAQVLQTIYHPSIPRYLNYFEVNQPYLKGFALVQNYIKAASLEEHLKAGRTFKIKEVKQLAESILNILIYLHSRKPTIIHRDIKPSNILLTSRSRNNIGDVYLVDFGSVKTLTISNTGTMTVVGTYGYMSPEHFGGKVVPTSDLYSLGATLIYLLTGIHPANLPQKDGCIQFEHLVNCPEDFTTWLKKMVQPAKELRFTSAKAALRSLKKPANNKINIVQKSIKKKSSNLIKVKKPFGSKIIFHENKKKLDILIPPIGLRKLKDELIVFIMKILASVIILPFVLFSMFMMPVFLFEFFQHTILFLPIIFGIIYLFIWVIVCTASIALAIDIIGDFIHILVNTFQKERLKIDRTQIYLSYYWLSFKIRTTQFIPLKIIDSFEKILISNNDNSKWEIVANLGKSQYKLTDKSDLTEVEVDWLCKELNEYLHLSTEYRRK